MKIIVFNIYSKYHYANVTVLDVSLILTLLGLNECYVSIFSDIVLRLIYLITIKPND